MDTSNKYCSILFDVLESKGVRDVVCSPGSRNVPLLLAAAAREKMKKHFAVDERNGAFMALGMASVSNRPVALICTSGTALLDYSPAIAEAFYQGVPLIVISADRPIQWIDQDDSQTLRQDGVLDFFVKKSFSIPAAIQDYNGNDNKEMEWYVDRLANEAMITATSGRQGPVHINVHLSEPLNGQSENKHNHRLISAFEPDTIGNREIFKEWAKELSSLKIMLVAGFGRPDAALQKAVSEFRRFPNVAIMAETISNLHLPPQDYSVDSVLSAYPSEELDELAPEVIISIGGSLVSRKLKEYLRRNSSSCQHWAVGPSNFLADPFFSLSKRIEIDPVRFFRGVNALMKKLKVESSYQEDWNEKRCNALRRKAEIIEAAPWSELKAFDFILKRLPSDVNLFLSNGTPIRYDQILPHPLPHASYCNRGVSGIDGSVSTAIGGAIVYKGPTIIITGDLSMAYDIGSLALKETPQRFKIIIIDNQGGGIFRFIPSTSNLTFLEEYLCQPPLLPLQQLAEGYGYHYFECSSYDQLEKVFPRFLDSSVKSLLRISVDGIASAATLRSYFSS
ncbi:MAG: 2-succinyl-5-enolpyruvyl-6-hydroxy-3-cyclohexene-1-carboxylic-acid synthase [Muribaculaceae bacterium]|nr:2-succinyl-5-enolpyruvyl-6-hydroxy-3-cyclohexene-1-carboxylic-acid synthase [Muribaculaceae bacterium]